MSVGSAKLSEVRAFTLERALPSWNLTFNLKKINFVKCGCLVVVVEFFVAE